MYLSSSFSVCDRFMHGHTHTPDCYDMKVHRCNTWKLQESYSKSSTKPPILVSCGSTIPHPHCPYSPPSKFHPRGKSLVHHWENLILKSLIVLAIIGAICSQASCWVWPPVSFISRLPRAIATVTARGARMLVVGYGGGMTLTSPLTNEGEKMAIVCQPSGLLALIFSVSACNHCSLATWSLMCISHHDACSSELSKSCGDNASSIIDLFLQLVHQCISVGNVADQVYNSPNGFENRICDSSHLKE